jgi:hypothetical protein
VPPTSLVAATTVFAYCMADGVDPFRPFRSIQFTYMVDMVNGDEEEVVVGEQPPAMEIGWPTDVRHVTFDRFHGFRGVPVELQPEVDDGGIKAPSASKTVFGVWMESMQCSYDGRGNSIPTILLQMQRRLYDHGGLAADDAQEQYVRNQLNAGVVPDGVDVHCLAGLIKVRFFLFNSSV